MTATASSTAINGIFQRTALTFALLFVALWWPLFFGWPPPLDLATPSSPVQGVFRWVTTGVLGLDPYFTPHVGLLLSIGTAVVSAVIWWSRSASRRTDANTRAEPVDNIVIAAGARTIIRFVLAGVMLLYGVPMMFALFGQPPGPVEWVSLIAELRARDIMDLGVSYAPGFARYNGFVLVLAGVLLLWRRTTKIGALIVLLAIGHAAVQVSGFTHDGRRLDYGSAGLAGYLLLFATILLAQEGGRVLSFLVLGRRAIRPAIVAPSAPSFTGGTTGRALHVAALLLAIVPPTVRTVQMKRDRAARSPLAGVYHTEVLTRNGTPMPLAADTPGRWWVVAISDYADHMTIRNADGTRHQLDIGDSTPREPRSWRRQRARATGFTSGTLQLRDRSVGENASPFDRPLTGGSFLALNYRRSSNSGLVLHGRVWGDAIVAELRRVADTTFAVYNREWR